MKGRVSRLTTGWVLLLVAAGISSGQLLAQNNPVPFVNQPLVPSAVAPGGPSFTLTVNGTGFVSGATVNWNATPLMTTFVSGSQLTATVPAANIAVASTASIAVVNPGTSVASDVLYLGVAAPESNMTFGTGPIASLLYDFDTVAADVNNDGNLDLVTLTGHTDSNSLEVELGNGDGTFGAPILSPPTSGEFFGARLALADFNGDGILDGIACGGGVYRDQCTIFLGNGDGTFSQGRTVSLPSGSFVNSNVVVGDFNGDGNLDFAVFGSAGFFIGARTMSVEVFPGNGDGTFGPPVATGTFPTGLGDYLTVGDFNGDGKLDIAYAATVAGEIADGPAQVGVLLGNGDGTFNPGWSYTLVNNELGGMVAADLNGDGELDLATLSGGCLQGGGCSYGLVSVFLGKGDGTFTTSTNGYGGAPFIWQGSWPHLVSADFNGDGKLDLATINSDNSDSILLGGGDGTFNQAITLSGLPASGLVLVTGDFDHNGRPDLASNGFVLLQGPPVFFYPPDCRLSTVVGTSASKTVQMTNLTGSTLTNISLVLTGANADEFSQTSTCGARLDVGSQCAITITFAPTSTGLASASISVSDSGPSSPQTFALSGDGTNPTATLSSTSLNFGSQPLSVTSTPQTVTLTNTGIGELLISSITPSGDFAQTNNCGSSVAEGASCAINVTLTPRAAGSETGTLTISDDALGAPQTVSLSGSGVAPSLTLGSASLTFANQLVGTRSSPQALNITNTGPGPATVTSIVASGDFSQTNNCVGTLAASASCQVNITFNPTAMGTRAGGISIADDANGSPQTIGLTGTGISPVVALAPIGLTFSNQGVGITSTPQTVTLSNTGTASLSIRSIVVNPGFAETNNCGASVAAGAGCTISVTFSPTATGTTLGQLTFTDSALGSPQGVPLTGTGINGAGAVFSPAALSLPATLLDSSSSSETLTLTNTGNAALKISAMVPTGDFALAAAGTTCSASSSVAVGAVCTISVTFAPTAGGPRTGSLTVTDNAVGSPQTVALSGTGEDFAVSSNPTSMTISAGGTATFALSVAPQGGFNQATNLSCSMSPVVSEGPACSVSPTSVIPNGSNATVTMTVTTTAPTLVAPQSRERPFGEPGPFGEHSSPLQVWLLALAMLAAVAAASLGRSRPRAGPALSLPKGGDRWIPASAGMTNNTPASSYFALALTLSMLLAWASCGGGATHRPGTPAGTYTITITAVSGNLSNSTTVSVTVIP